MKAADKKAKEAVKQQKRSGELQEELKAEQAKTAAAEKELKELKARIEKASAMQILAANALQAAAQPQQQPQS